MIDTENNYKILKLILFLEVKESNNIMTLGYHSLERKKIIEYTKNLKNLLFNNHKFDGNEYKKLYNMISTVYYPIIV